ncbi:MAG: hypothetical protein ACHQQQ_14525 [Bacteroidota bacterium]
MAESDELKTIIKWLGFAVIAAIPIYVLIKKLSSESDSDMFDESEIFAEELAD